MKDLNATRDVRFLFRFGYETPTQHFNNKAKGWDDEDSEAVFIECDDADTALAWGREVAEHFVQGLWAVHGEPGQSWKAGEFAHWIEARADEITAAKTHAIQTVRVGEHPVWPARAPVRPTAVSAIANPRRPLYVAMAAALVALVLIITGPIGPLWRDALWSACITVAAAGMAMYERGMARAGKPVALLRWIALGLILVAIAFLVYAAQR